MKLLLDTHFIVWMAMEQDQLSDRDHAIIADPDAIVYVSVLSIWEIRIKWNTLHRSGDRKGLLSPDRALRLVNKSGFSLASLHPEHVCATLDPTIAHRDPFDELLLVHAEQLGARLLTRDSQLIGHPLAYHP